MSRRPCRRCQQVRIVGFVLLVFLLAGYGLLQSGFRIGV